MQGEKKERWRELCEQVITEQDGEKVHALAMEIERLLQEKEDRLNGRKPVSRTDSDQGKVGQKR